MPRPRIANSTISGTDRHSNVNTTSTRTRNDNSDSPSHAHTRKMTVNASRSPTCAQLPLIGEPALSQKRSTAPWTAATPAPAQVMMAKAPAKHSMLLMASLGGVRMPEL